MSDIRLSPAEAHNLVQLSTKLEEHRLYCLEYMLLRASCSQRKSTKRAWYILICLFQFVERKQRFPRYKEMMNFLDLSLKDLGKDHLPPFSQADLLEVREVQRQAVLSLQLLAEERERRKDQ